MLENLTLKDIASDILTYTIQSIRGLTTLVRSIQTELNRLGFNAGRVDGVWGSGTQAAYQAFARRYGLPANDLSPQAARVLLTSGKTTPAPTPAPQPSTPKPSTPTPTQPKPAPSTPSLSVLEEALKFTLKWEGGYVNHPADRGGETNKGITAATYRSYRARKKLPLQSVRHITDAEVREIYETLYWQPAQCASMIRPLAIVHFDTAVNFGVGGATIFLQEALGVRVDQVFGPMTRNALTRANQADLAKRYGQTRIDYRYRRVNRDPSQRVFLKGWLNRDNDLLRYIASMT